MSDRCPLGYLFTVANVFTKFIKLKSNGKNDKICYINASYTCIYILVSSILLNIKMWLYSQSKLEDHTTDKGDLHGLHDAFDVCIFFISI